MRPVFRPEFAHQIERKPMCFGALFDVWRMVTTCCAPKQRHTSTCFGHTNENESVAQKLQPTETDRRQRNSATLLFFRIINVRICTHTHTHIGVSIDRRLKCCAPARSRRMSADFLSCDLVLS